MTLSTGCIMSNNFRFDEWNAMIHQQIPGALHCRSIAGMVSHVTIYTPGVLPASILRPFLI